MLFSGAANVDTSPAVVGPESENTYDALKKMNPDYVGWIQQTNAGLDYPIVQGTDNEMYLETTFEGNENPSGSVYMDSRNENGFKSRHVILYAHAMNNGTMFGNLHLYLDEQFIKSNPTIDIVTANGSHLKYRVFSANTVDAWNECYEITEDEVGFAYLKDLLDAPDGTEYLLTLSTCTLRGNKDDRVVVHAVLDTEASVFK